MGFFEHLAKYRDSSGYEPPAGSEPDPTQFLPGSDDKVALLRRRIEQGQELWSEKDRLVYDEDDEA